MGLRFRGQSRDEVGKRAVLMKTGSGSAGERTGGQWAYWRRFTSSATEGCRRKKPPDDYRGSGAGGRLIQEQFAMRMGRVGGTQGLAVNRVPKARARK